MTARLTLIFVTCFIAYSAFGQYNFQSAADYPYSFLKDGKLQKLAASGGLNNPQVTITDLDGDGTNDIYIFDRLGDVHLAFTTTGPDVEDWTYRPDLVAGWPEAIAFALLRDFDRDGLPDMFAHADPIGRSGLLVYKGFRQNGRLQFREVQFASQADNALRYSEFGNEQIIYVAITDVPSIADLDGDGDLDILTFDAAGGYIDHFENVGVGNGGPSSFLRFRRDSECYGGVFETNLDGRIKLSDTPGACAQPFRPDDSGILANRSGFHPGSTITSYDLDADGDQDLLLGDVNTGFVTELLNQPNNGDAFFTNVVYEWPPSSTEVNIDNFPAVYVGNLAATSGIDFLASPSNNSGGEDINVLWRYTANADGTGVTFRQKDFLANQAFDHGRGSHFAMADLSGDGIQDILVGNDSEYMGDNAPDAKLSLYIYDASTSTYTEQNPNWLANINVTVRNTLPGLRPSFFDMDADGDLDLIIGNNSGYVFYAPNTAGAGNVANYPTFNPRWMDIDVGAQSAVAISDLSGDGLPDLLIGEKRGKLSYFVNIGTVTNPMFSDVATEDNYAGIDIRIPGFFSTVNARPRFAQVAGETVLYIGSGQGRMQAYGNLPQAAGGTATLLAELDIRDGINLDPSFGLDPLGNTIILLGNERGGVSFYRQEGFVSTKDVLAIEQEWTLAPNPTRGNTQLIGLAPDQQIQVTSVDGRSQLLNAEAFAKTTFAAGVYFVTPTSKSAESFFKTRRLVVVP